MEHVTELKRNPLGLQIQIILSAVLMIVIGLIASWLFAKLLGWTSRGGSTAETLTWIILALVWVVGSLKVWFDWRVKRYEVSADSLIVHARLGAFGSTQTIYRYESIISIRMTQGFLGKQFGYGDVRVTIPKLDHELVMNDIENPTIQLAEIRKRIDERSSEPATALLS